MRKVLCILSENKEIKEHADLIKKRRDEASERIKFLKKQAEDEMKKCDKENDPRWDTLRDLIHDKLPDDYTEEKYSLTFSIDEDTLSIEDKNNDKDPFSRFIDHLTNR